VGNVQGQKRELVTESPSTSPIYREINADPGVEKSSLRLVRWSDGVRVVCPVKQEHPRYLRVNVGEGMEKFGSLHRLNTRGQNVWVVRIRKMRRIVGERAKYSSPIRSRLAWKGLEM